MDLQILAFIPESPSDFSTGLCETIMAQMELGGGVEVAATIQVPQDFDTITAAMEVAENGDTILVSAGTYEESLLFNKSINLIGHNCKAHECVITWKDASVVKFREQTGKLKNVTLRVSEAANWIHCLVIEGGDVVIEGCELTGGAWGMCVSKNAKVTVSGCHLHDNKGCGISVHGGSFVTITESEICHNVGRGVSISEEGTRVVMRGCDVHDCSSGVYLYKKGRLEMEENYIHSNLDTGLSVHDEGTQAVISRNYLQRNGWGGIRVYTGAKASIADNDLQENVSGALSIDRHSKKNVVTENNLDAPVSRGAMQPLNQLINS